MSVPFRDYAAAAAAVIDKIAGEAFLVFPIALVGGKFVADVTRAPFEISANLTEKAAYDIERANRGERRASALSSEQATAHIEIEINADDLPYSLKTKDRFQRVGDGIFYEINGVQADDLDHISFLVTKLGPAAS